MKTIPISTEGRNSFSIAVELDGRTWRLGFRWNHRMEQWRMDLSDGAGTLLVSGIGVVIDLPLLDRFRGRESLPTGEIVALNSTGRKADPGFEDLGTAVQIFYVPASEFP